MTSPGEKEIQSSVNEETFQVTSDFLTATVAPRKSARLSSALLNYRRPDGLNPIPMGSSWGLDVFARLHNGTRRELIDMYNMMDSMHRNIQELRTSDLKLFFNWWNLFSSYVEVSLNAHSKILIPWVVKKAAMPNSLSNAVRVKMEETMNAMLKMFDSIYGQLQRRAPDETMAKIIKALADMHLFVEYMEKFENEVSLLVEESYKPRDAKAIEKKLAMFLHKSGDQDFRHMHLCVVARGMTENSLSAWRKYVPIWVRIAYRSNGKLFENTHISVVRKLTVVGIAGTR